MAFESDMMAFLAALDLAIEDTMLQDVTDETTHAIQEALYEEVYSYSASPLAMASRRYEKGGLADPGNIFSTFDNETGILEVADIAPFQDGDIGYGKWLTEVVEEGDANFAQPYQRPFIQKAEEKMSEGRFEQALTSGLQKRGFEVT